MTTEWVLVLTFTYGVENSVSSQHIPMLSKKAA
jgi:hypothetical protein